MNGRTFYANAPVSLVQLAGTGLRAGLILVLILNLAGCDNNNPATDTPLLTKVERTFLEARLDKTVEILSRSQRDSFDNLIYAYVMALKGDVTGAKQAFQDAMTTPLQDHKRQLLFQALVSLFSQNMDRALSQLVSYRQQNPDDFFASVLGIEWQIETGKSDSAKKELAVLLKRYPGEPIIYHTRGHLYSARKKWRKAVNDYEYSRILGGENPDLDAGIAAALIELGDYAAAQTIIMRCKTNFPEFHAILFEEIRLTVKSGSGTQKEAARLLSKLRQLSQDSNRIKEAEAMIQTM